MIQFETTWAVYCSDNMSEKEEGKYKHMKRTVESLYKRKGGKGEKKKCLKRFCDLCMACFPVRENDSKFKYYKHDQNVFEINRGLSYCIKY